MLMHPYDVDFDLWAKEQAKALAEHRFADLDLKHLVEEVEDLGASERRELKNRITTLMMHLLKWKHQPERRTDSWFDTITEQRESIEDLLVERPSLKPTIEEVTLGNYGRAVKLAMAETKLPREAFPAECPYKFNDLMELRFDS